MSRGRAWISLLAGIVVIAAAWWLLNRPSGTDSDATTTSPAPTTASTATPTPKATGASARADGIPANAAAAQAHWTIDGDTIDIEVGGVVERFRLVGINAPERRSGATPPECLSSEAAGLLIELAPHNTPLRIVRHGRDRYGRTLGEAWLADGRMLGAEITRAGLAAPLVVGGVAPYRGVIEAARDEAAAAGRGLHSPRIACTVPARTAALASPRDPNAAALFAELTARAPHAGVAALTAAQRASLVATARARD